jgi:predicted glycosyltransferase
MTKMKLFFYMGHPAHFHLFREPIKLLEAKGVECVILIKSKDVLEDLLKTSGLNYINVFEGERKEGFLPLLSSFISKLWTLARIVYREKPDLLIASAAEFAIIGKVLRIPSCILFEDDFEAIPQFAKLVGPFATKLVCPSSCSSGKWQYKTINYQGYHELAYLSPKYFSPDRSTVEHLLNKEGKNFLLRFSKLTAYHDTGINGIQDELAMKLVGLLEDKGKVFITSERPLQPNLERHRVQIDPKQMHDFLAQMDLLVCDSQTMTAEAAVLGIPSVRYNGFVGRLGYLEELEHKYRLTKGVRVGNVEELTNEVKKALDDQGLKSKCLEGRRKMLEESVDVTRFLTDLFLEFPNVPRFVE